MIIETKRLILRPWRESDAEDLFRYASAPEVGPSAGWPVHTSVQNSLEIIRNVLAVPETYAVVPKAVGHAAGSISLMLYGDSALVRSEREAEVGYWIGKPYWGQGLIPEAVCALQRHAFQDLQMERLWCGYYDGNEKSRRVQEKCGFIYHDTKKNVPRPLLGDAKDEHITCMTKEMWLKHLG